MKNLLCCGGIFDLDEKIEKIQELTAKQEDPATWIHSSKGEKCKKCSKKS